MADIHLVTGGSRSGKSEHAMRLAEEREGGRTYVATCPVTDEDMQARVEKHRERRRGRGWQTVEETTKLADAVADIDNPVVLIDCLTLWVNNLMREAGELTEKEMARRTSDLMDICRDRSGTVILVTNEVGMGVVPSSRQGRRFRDLAGRCNQAAAEEADSVTLMVCGIPVDVKEHR